MADFSIYFPAGKQKMVNRKVCTIREYCLINLVSQQILSKISRNKKDVTFGKQRNTAFSVSYDISLFSPYRSNVNNFNLQSIFNLQSTGT